MTLTKILFFKNQKSLDNQISEDFEDQPERQYESKKCKNIQTNK